MKTALAPGTKSPAAVNLKKSLLESFSVNEKVNQLLIGDAAWQTFIGYLVAHDSHRRGQIAMMARQVGHPAPPKITFGLWEWGRLWKECGFGDGLGK